MSKYIKKALKKLNQRQVAHAATLKSLPPRANPAAWRQPGSMKRKKG